MTRKTTPRQPRRRPPASAPPPLPSPHPESLPAAGGPSTRVESSLGRFLIEVLAFFEVRSVTRREIDLLRPTHENGWLRPEIEGKLARLHPTCPDHRELRRLVRLSLDLLEAVDEGRFDPGPAWAQIEPRLLRALAYFVREGDAIPDHLPHGFDDDQREFAELAEQAGVVLTIFEVRHQRQDGSGPALP
jgi:hypothetical protein